MDSASPGETRNVTEGVRAFNRYYTHKIGLLNNHLYGTDFSLTESRMIFHVGENNEVAATEMAALFNLDAGYTSRVIKKLVAANILKKQKSETDSRMQYLSLTANGKKVLERLIRISNGFIDTLLSPLAVSERLEVLSAMNRIQTLLEKGRDSADIYTIRSFKPGDLGYVAASHMALYGAEYRFDGSFEYYVGKAVMAFAETFDPDRENLWIAEERSRRVGSLAIVNNGQGVAQLRWLLVDAQARGKGLGEKLVQTGVSFAQEKQYEKIILMTIDFLDAARHVYEKFGFRQTSSESGLHWGRQMNIEYLELEL